MSQTPGVLSLLGGRKAFHGRPGGADLVKERAEREGLGVEADAATESYTRSQALKANAGVLSSALTKYQALIQVDPLGSLGLT